MLNKELCKECHARSGDAMDEWDDLDEQDWGLYDRVICPWDLHKCHEDYTYIFCGPPDWCPHFFEHAVFEGMADA
jgi:hypothetical protein